MTRHIIAAAAALLSLQCAQATNIFSHLEYRARIGYNLGGTAPIGMPATIRSLDSYKLQANSIIGIDATHKFNDRWGLSAGLHYENKGMKTDAKVKNYHMEMRRSDESLEGMFTGNVLTKVDELMFTVPVMATCDVARNVRLSLGPYVSYILRKEFSGYAYNGYLRVGDPTGSKVELGSTETERGDYDFSADMRHWQMGLDFTADWYVSHRWGVYAGLSWGLNSIFFSSFKTIEQKLYPIYGTVGLSYRLK